MKKFNYTPFIFARNRCYFNECAHIIIGPGVPWALPPIFRFVNEFMGAFREKV